MPPKLTKFNDWKTIIALTAELVMLVNSGISFAYLVYILLFEDLFFVNCASAKQKL